MPGQPGNALNVEVVGRFVECQNIPVADQQCSERYAPALSAGKRGDLPVPVKVAHEACDDVADVGVGGPFVFGAVAHDCCADGVIRVEVVGLGENSHAQTAALSHAAGIGFQLAGQQRHER